jgi:hypothetical protein
VHVRYVCIALSTLSYLIHALHSFLGTIYFIPIFSLVVLRNICRYFWGWQLKHVERLLFCLGISKPISMRTGLVLPYMLGLDVISFSISMSLFFFCLFVFNKKFGEKMRNFIFLLITFKILHVFLPNISVHYALINYAYIWLRVYAWYLLSFHVAS